MISIDFHPVNYIEKNFILRQLLGFYRFPSSGKVMFSFMSVCLSTGKRSHVMYNALDPTPVSPPLTCDLTIQWPLSLFQSCPLPKYGTLYHRQCWHLVATAICILLAFLCKLCEYFVFQSWNSTTIKCSNVVTVISVYYLIKSEKYSFTSIVCLTNFLTVIFTSYWGVSTDSLYAANTTSENRSFWSGNRVCRFPYREICLLSPQESFIPFQWIILVPFSSGFMRFPRDTKHNYVLDEYLDTHGKNMLQTIGNQARILLRNWYIFYFFWNISLLWNVTMFFIYLELLSFFYSKFPLRSFFMVPPFPTLLIRSSIT